MVISMSSLDLLELEQESKRLSEQGQSNDFLNNFVKFPEGPGHVVVRILGPSPAGMFDRPKSPLYQYTRTHRVNNKSVHCSKTMNGTKWVGECPVCRYYSWLWQESEKQGVTPDEAARLQAQARDLKPIERYYYNVIVRSEVDEKTGEKRENVGPKILSIGKTLHQMIIDNILGSTERSVDKLGDVTDFKTGRDFKIIKQIVKSGKDSYPSYSTSKFLDPSAIDVDQGKIWVANEHDLVALRHVMPEEDMKRELKIHLGVIPSAQNDGFDPSEYRVNTPSTTGASAPVVTKTELVVEKELRAEAPPIVEESVGVVDEEFFNSLRSIKVD
jgi:hypothetical protein